MFLKLKCCLNFEQDFEVEVKSRCLVEISKSMLCRDSEDEIWSRFVKDLCKNLTKSEEKKLW